MAITPNINRQTVLYAEVDIDVVDIKAAGSYDAIWLPKGARVLGGFLDVLTASDDTGTHTIDVGDKAHATPDVDKYLDGANLKAAGLNKFTLPPLTNTGSTVLGVIPAGGTWLTVTSIPENADAAAGKIKVAVWYVVADRVTEYEPYRG
jgi:hypothetical protein